MNRATYTTSPKHTRRIAWGRLAAVSASVAIWVLIFAVSRLVG